MAINKVVYGDDTLIDLSGDTVTANKLASGYTAHNSAGESITGTGDIQPENLFSMSICSYEQNIEVHMQTGDTGCYFKCDVFDRSSVYFVLDPDKTYNLRWWATNCGLAAYTEDWSTMVFNVNDSDGLHSVSNVTNVCHCYFYRHDLDGLDFGMFQDVVITEA